MWKIFYFPHYHYDVVWKFNREDYSYINEKIFQQIVELSKKYPDFKFGIEDIYQFIDIKKRNPKLFQKIKGEIKKGKIEIIDGQYLAADTFLPGGEVLAREILWGKKYAKEKFKKDIKMGWPIDSFGFNSQIPQIYKDSGYQYLVFRRGYKVKPNQAEFYWQGLDGTRILTHCLSSSHAYHVGIFTHYFRENIEELKKFAATKNLLMPCGIGSCPFPTWAFEAIKNWNKNYPDQKIKISSPEEFFKAVQKEEKNLKIQRGEMYSGPWVFEGVWSTRIWLKLEYFKVKNLILNAEKFATLAYLLGKEYPKEKLEKCWEKILFLAFHDVLPGCSLDEVYDEVKEIYSFLNKELSQILNDSLKYLASQVNFSGQGVIVFNPTNFEIENYVVKEIEIKRKAKGIRMEIPDWEILEEKRDKQGYLKKIKIGFLVKIPPLGYKVYKIIPTHFEDNQFSNKAEIISQEPNFIENNFFKVKLDGVTGSWQIFNQKGEEVLKGGQLEIENEVGSVYSHRDISMNLVGLVGKQGEKKGSHKSIFKIESLVGEKGKIYQKIRIKENVFGCFWPYRLYEDFGIELYRQKLLEIEREIKIFKNLPWLEITLKVKTNFPHIRLRSKFDANFRGNYLAHTPFGITKRNKEKRDFPMEDWLIYDGKNQGLVLATQGICGHQVVENSIYLTLLRSVNLISHGDKGPIVPVNDALELGKSFEYKYAIFPYTGINWQSSEIWKQVQTYLNPPLAIELKGLGKGKLPLEFSFLKLPANLILSTLKLAEDKKSIILRCYETSGKGGDFNFEFFKKPKKILTSNITEEKEEPSFLKKINPFKILTLKLKF